MHMHLIRGRPDGVISTASRPITEPPCSAPSRRDEDSIADKHWLYVGFIISANWQSADAMCESSVGSVLFTVEI